MSRGDEMEPASAGPPTGLEGFFANNGGLLIFLSICCNVFYIFGILGIVGLVTFKDPQAKQNAKTVVIISAVLLGLSCILGILPVALGIGTAKH